MDYHIELFGAADTTSVLRLALGKTPIVANSDRSALGQGQRLYVLRPDVSYARVVDGLGTVIWESGPWSS